MKTLDYLIESEKLRKQFPAEFREMEEFLISQMEEKGMPFFPLECFSNFFDPLQIYITPFVVLKGEQEIWTTHLECEGRLTKQNSYTDRSSAIVGAIAKALETLHIRQLKTLN